MNPCVIYKTLEGADPTEALTEMLGRYAGAEYNELWLFVERPVAGDYIDLRELFETDEVTGEVSYNQLQAMFDDPLKTTKAIWITVEQAHAMHAANKTEAVEEI